MHRIFRLLWLSGLLLLVMQPLDLTSATVHAEGGELEDSNSNSFHFSQIAWAQKKTEMGKFPTISQPSRLVSAEMTTDIFRKLNVHIPKQVTGQFEMGTPIEKLVNAWLPGDLLYYGDTHRNDHQPEWVAIVVDSEHIAYGGPEQSIVYRAMKEVNRQYPLLGVRRILSQADRKRFSLILRAGKYIGAPYVLGARYGQTASFDCSSFIKTIYASEGISLPRVSRQQAKVGQRIALQDIRVGDLLFFTGRHSERQVAHVAMYAGSGMMIHTYGKGGVRYTALNHPVWKQRFVMARRVVI